MILDQPMENPLALMEARLESLENQLASGADTSLPWWQQKVGPVPTWVVFGAVGTMAFLGWWRSRK